MLIIVFCKKCAKKIRVSAGPPGRFGRCPRCQARVAIPANSEVAPPKLEVRFVDVNTETLPEDAPTPVETQAAVQSVCESALRAVSAESSKPQTPIPPGKPARIALDWGKLGIAAPQEAPRSAGQAEAKSSFVLATPGVHKWDTSPDPPRSRLPWIMAFLVGAAMLGGFTVWLWTKDERAQPRTAPEERKRQQFQLPAEKDEYDRLRESIPGKEKKTGKSVAAASL